MEPPAKKQKQEPSSKSIIELNDDCLIEIFSYFSIRELVELDKVCPRFRDVADGYFYRKEKVLVINAKFQTQENVANLAERMGPFVPALENQGLRPWLAPSALRQCQLDPSMTRI
ncbi:hypothetical protein DMENIID0001_009450 [Sergentomyia squamirostris]